MELDYEALRAQKQRPKRDPAVQQERRREIQRRSGVAQSRALIALSHAFPDEYTALYQAAKAGLASECGPLPGDVDDE